MTTTIAVAGKGGTGKTSIVASFAALAREVVLAVVCDHGVQVLGGHGYIRDYPQERCYRNGRGISILEGIATL